MSKLPAPAQTRSLAFVLAALIAIAFAALAIGGCGEKPLDETEFRELEDGLELHWTFEDHVGNQITDLSGNERHGTLQGGGAFVASGSGEALSLDGVDDYVSFSGPRAPALYGGVDGDFTISARVRVADVEKDNTLCYGCGPFNSMFVGTASYGARVMAPLFDQGANGLVWPWTTVALANDTWVEVTMIVEGGGLPLLSRLRARFGAAGPGRRSEGLRQLHARQGLEPG